jgi:hypothetical protein
MVGHCRIVDEDRDSLRELFLTLGKKNGVKEELLEEVLEILVKNQFFSKGDRGHIQVQLRRLISSFEAD